MKLLTLNTHAWHEENQLEKIGQLAAFINEQQFDIIAMQEVNQLAAEEVVAEHDLGRYYTADPETIIRRDNYAYVLLQQLDVDYYWTWIPVHSASQRKLDEGLAILSRTPLTDHMYGHVSQLQDYNNSKTRKILAVQTEQSGQPVWLVNGHFGWWNDEIEPFRQQWDEAEKLLEPYQDQLLFFLGDFNNVAEIRGEGYDYMMKQIWHDTYTAASVKDDGHTVVKSIAGWEGNARNLRIDYIYANRPVQVQSSHVALNGVNGAVVSDHFGVMAVVDI
ncbi:endonuclease/exonuclease/phosphatase family protein [Paenibacillus wulumuqiensis]|uniref:endonuclease/exonuclease/phosphatase family protein n=1 Tax=Paenibacillus wulumuqiensis TaxID=1567107 RepID=UPI000619B788|nr:endonuclease/exonuclease/phosphatase family protein [Paenibacillus wulumuqiensis]